MDRSDSLLEPLRLLEIAAEWFRVAYRMQKEPSENPHLYRQLQEMRKQLNELEEKVKGPEIRPRMKVRAAKAKASDPRQQS